MQRAVCCGKELSTERKASLLFSFLYKRKEYFIPIFSISLARRIKINEEDLIHLLTLREAKGFEILYDNYSAALYGVIHRIVQNDAIAEDVLQETFLKIWNNIGQYESAKGRLFSWMINIARNGAIDKIRSKEYTDQQKNRQLEKTVLSENAEMYSAYNPDTIGLRQIVQKLEPEYRQIVELLFFNGYSQSAAAEKLNIPLGTVKTRSRAALQKLRTYFSTEAGN